MHLNATLVAPLDTEPVDNVSNTRSVWIPPGDWVDGWTGAVTAGPKTVTITQPPERIPMWHKSGGLVVLNHINK
jgi:alpha-D-xyloside xylohydrolase